jgi:hypothetical protein
LDTLYVHSNFILCVTKIQAAFVSFTARKNYLYMLSRVLICQSAFRKKIAKIRFNSLLAKKESAALMIQKTYRGFAGQKLVSKKAIQEFSQPPIHPTPEKPITPTAEAPAAGPSCRLSSRRLMVLGLGAGGATSLGLGVGLGKQKNALTALNTTQVPTAAPAIDDICGLDLTAAPATEDFFDLGLTGAPVGLSLEDIFGLGLTDSPTAEASITETPIMSAPTTLTSTTKLDLHDAPSAVAYPTETPSNTPTMVPTLKASIMEAPNPRPISSQPLSTDAPTEELAASDEIPLKTMALLSQ